MESRITLNSPAEVFFHKLSSNEVIKTKIVGVIDCSGSMVSDWATLTTCWNNIVSENNGNIGSILFSTRARMKKGGFIQKSDCGGMTNIESAFTALNEVLERHDPETNFTVVFISDGADNNMDTIKDRLSALNNPNPKTKINFICVGVRSAFPTFLAMDLRAKYHRGSTEVPSVFVINNREEFESTFTRVSTYLSMGKPIKLKSDVVAFPWSDKGVIECSSGQFVISNEEVIESEEGPSKGRKASQLRKDEIEVLFKAWTQELMIQSISRNVESEAKNAVAFMNEVMKASGSQKGDGGKMTVLQRLAMRRAKTDDHNIQSLIAEVKRLATGERLGNLSEKEAAARLAIGTKEGKYHNKAMELRGISSKEYEIYKDKFVELLENLKVSEETSQEPSVLSLQTFKEVLAEEGLAEAVKSSNQYEFIETFPLIGNAIKVRRSDASMISPFKIDVLSFSKINTVVDSISLQEKGYEMNISIGNGDSESVNCILPIFDEVDKDVQPVLKSKLFSLLMTYNCSMNADTLFYEAYYALLANTFAYILREPNTEFRKETIRKIVFTTELAYGGAKFFENGLTKLKKDPRKAAITEDSEDNYKCEAISKYLLNAFILRSRGEINDSELKNIADLAFIEHVGRSLKGKKDDIYILTKKKDPRNIKLEEFKDANEKRSNYKPKRKNEEDHLEDVQELFEPNPEEQIELKLESISDYISYDLIDICATAADLKIAIKNIIKEKQSQILAEQEMHATMDVVLLNRSMGTMNIAFFQNLFEEVGLSELTSDAVYVAVNHAVANTSSKERCTEDIERNVQTVVEDALDQFVNNIINTKMNAEIQAIETKFVSLFSNKTKAAIERLKSANLNCSILSKAAKIPETQDQNQVLVVGPRSGKSTLIGRLLCEMGGVDESEFSRYTKTFQDINKNNELPYNWVANVSSQSRAKGETLSHESRCVMIGNKLTTVVDTPSKLTALDSSLTKCYFSTSIIFCFNPQLSDYISWRDQVRTLLIAIKMHKITKISVVFSRIDMFSDFEEQSKFIMEDFTKTCKQIGFNINVAVSFCSVRKDINIGELNGIGERTVASLFTENEDETCHSQKTKKTQTELLVQNYVTVEGEKVVIGIILNGFLKRADKLYLEGKNKTFVTVKRIEVNYNQVQTAQKGDSIGISFKESGVKLIPGEILKSTPFEENKSPVIKIKAKVLQNDAIKSIRCFYVCTGFTCAYLQINRIMDLNENVIGSAEKDETVVLELIAIKVNSVFYYDNQKPNVLLIDSCRKVVAAGAITEVI